MAVVKIGHFDVKIDHKLGEGGFGAVYRAIDNSEDPPVGCVGKQQKVRSQAEERAVREEVEVLKLVNGHPCIIALRGFEVDGNYRWTFMELASGGELFDRLIDAGCLSEKAMWPYAKGLVQAVQHCHARGVIHRDIKLENIMLCAEDPDAIKLIDFGLASVVGTGANGQPNGTTLYEAVGTKSYRAPELTRSGYVGPPVDIWAMGITLFSLASGFFPLDRADDSDWRFARLKQDQQRGLGACDAIYGMYKRACPFSAALREMLDAMLSILPGSRICLDDLAAHRWLNPPPRPEGVGYGGMEEDDYSDPVVYRSAGLGDEEDEAMTPFEPPLEAMRIMRQPAERDEGVLA